MRTFLDPILLLQASLWLFLTGSVLSLLLGGFHRKAGIYASGVMGMIASGSGLLSAMMTLLERSAFSLSLSVFQVPLVGSGLVVDPLAAFFILLICGAVFPVSLFSIGYLQAEATDRPVGGLGMLYHLFILSMLLVVTAGNGLLFLIGWESMALLSFLLVISDTASTASRKAGFLYLIMTHVGTAFIVLLFLTLWQHVGSLDFSAFAAAKGSLAPAIRHGLFALALIGFGAKAGIIPLHTWLPEAHPAAPSHISALMSGVMIKTAVYALLRCMLDFLGPVPLPWGVVILVVGLLTALLGIAYASVENDLKRLLAYSSIENMGIILLALGTGFVFQAMGHPLLAGTAFVGAFLHLLNHACFKGLLFMAAGAVLSATHTRLLDNLGGLIRRMPQTAFFFLIGALAICAFPPLNGFVGEWLIYQSLLSSMQVHAEWLHLLMPLAAVILGLIGALAAATFVKAFSAGFLAMPRSHHAIHAREVSQSMRMGMGLLSLLCLVFGLFPTLLFPLLKPVIAFVNDNTHALDMIAGKGWFLQAALPGPASLSPMLAGGLLLVLAPMALILPRLLGGPTAMRREETWSCGVTPAPEFEYTATGFSQPMAWVYSKLQTTVDCYDRYLYIPVANALIGFSRKARTLQAGNLQLYLLYVFCTLVLCLAWIQWWQP